MGVDGDIREELTPTALSKVEFDIRVSLRAPAGRARRTDAGHAGPHRTRK